MLLAKLVKFTIQIVFPQFLCWKMKKFFQGKIKLLKNLQFSWKNQQFYATVIWIIFQEVKRVLQQPRFFCFFLWELWLWKLRTTLITHQGYVPLCNNRPTRKGCTFALHGYPPAAPPLSHSFHSMARNKLMT